MENIELVTEMDAYYDNDNTYIDKVQPNLIDNDTVIEYNANLVTQGSPVRENIEISNPSTETFDKRMRVKFRNRENPDLIKQNLEYNEFIYKFQPIFENSGYIITERGARHLISELKELNGEYFWKLKDDYYINITDQRAKKNIKILSKGTLIKLEQSRIKKIINGKY